MNGFKLNLANAFMERDVANIGAEAEQTACGIIYNSSNNKNINYRELLKLLHMIYKQ